MAHIAHIVRALKAAQVDVGDLIGGVGSIPLLFFLRDPSGNQLMLVEDQ